MFCQLFSLQNKSFLCLQHVENKGFQTVIKHRLKAIQKPIKNELGNREKKYKKCTFRFEKMHISFSRLYEEEKLVGCFHIFYKRCLVHIVAVVLSHILEIHHSVGDALAIRLIAASQHSCLFVFIKTIGKVTTNIHPCQKIFA